MTDMREWNIAAREVRALCWQGDALVDWVDGCTIYHLDGSNKQATIAYGYRFDAAAVSPSGKFAVIYEKLGTKGLVLQNRRPIREINRSFYHADAYEYPLALFSLPEGREVMANCPERYNVLVIDELAMGERRKQ